MKKYSTKGQERMFGRWEKEAYRMVASSFLPGHHVPAANNDSPSGLTITDRELSNVSLDGNSKHILALCRM